MRIRKWQLGIATGVLALAAGWVVSAAPNREDVMKRRKALMTRLEKTLSEKWNVMPTEGMFLKILAESSEAKRALEIGSSNGYSAIWIGSGLEQTGGHLWTIEIDAGRAEECRNHIKEAGLDKVVTSIEGDAFEEIPKLKDKGPWDFVFIDAGKPDYGSFFKMVFPNLEEGGVVVGHNAIAYRGAMKDYLELIQNHPELDTVILSTTMRDGMAVSYRKKHE